MTRPRPKPTPPSPSPPTRARSRPQYRTPRETRRPPRREARRSYSLSLIIGGLHHRSRRLFSPLGGIAAKLRAVRLIRGRRNLLWLHTSIGGRGGGPAE